MQNCHWKNAQVVHNLQKMFNIVDNVRLISSKNLQFNFRLKPSVGILYDFYPFHSSTLDIF